VVKTTVIVHWYYMPPGGLNNCRALGLRPLCWTIVYDSN